MQKVLWFVAGGALLGLAVYFMLGKSDREKILEKARAAKAEKSATEPAADEAGA